MDRGVMSPLLLFIFFYVVAIMEVSEFMDQVLLYYATKMYQLVFGRTKCTLEVLA